VSDECWRGRAGGHDLCGWWSGWRVLSELCGKVRCGEQSVAARRFHEYQAAGRGCLCSGGQVVCDRRVGRSVAFELRGTL